MPRSLILVPALLLVVLWYFIAPTFWRWMERRKKK